MASIKRHTREVTERFLEAADEIIGTKSSGRSTQTEFCVIVGISPSNLVRMKKEDSNNVTIEALCSLIEHYNYSPTWLLTGTGLKKKSEILNAKKGNSAIPRALQTIENSIQLIKEEYNSTSNKNSNKKH